LGGKTYTAHEGVWVADAMSVSREQEQTEKTFGFKWHKEQTFDSQERLAKVRRWAVDRYGDFGEILRSLPQGRPIVLDAGCGAAMTALEYLGLHFAEIRYIGVDVSSAAEVAARRVAERVFSGVFLQDDITALPFPKGSVDCIFSEGVLHHTDSTRNALASLAPLLKPGGLFLFYVYNKKGPLREFTDDHIREKLQQMKPAEAWEALRPLTELGIQLGRLNCALELPEGIPLLDVPAGKISLQRFFYWHVCKAFYDPDATFDEMHHINYDWFAPRNAHRQTPDEVKTWCGELGLDIERMKVEQAGITVVARKR
jgi:SAM-dependent methyltransferase